MSLLTKIVKSFAVVDDRQQAPHPMFPLEAPPLPDQTPVLKRGYLGSIGMPYTPGQSVRPKESYLDELNRVRVEIAQAKAELRTLTRQVGEAKDHLLTSQDEEAEEVGHILSVEEIEEMTEKAREQASQILEEAMQRAESIADEAKEDGYAQGFAQGFEEAKAEYKAENEPKAQKLAELIERLDQYELDMVQQNDEELVNLVIDVSEKIVRKEITAEPRLILSMLEDVIEENRRAEYIRIVIAPDLMPVEGNAGEKLRKAIEAAGAQISVQVNPELESGGCIVETQKGITDISVNTQLDNIRDNLLSE